MSMLVVSGVMIGYICSAVTEFVVTFADDSDIVNLHNWSRGSFSGMTWDSVGVMSIVVGITFVLFSNVKASYGISARRVICRKSGCKHKAHPGASGIAFKSAFRMYSGVCGTDIVCRNSRATHSKKHAKEHKAYIYDTGLLPWGAVFCLFCDLLARMMFAPTELSISTVTAVFGAPVVLFIMIRRKEGENV